MEIYRNNEDGYFEWIAANPEGFVLNARQSPGPSYLVIHSASCGHISGHASKYAQNAFTGRDYIKVCSIDIEELRAWARSLGAMAFSAICKDCQPVKETSVAEQLPAGYSSKTEGNTKPRATLTLTLTYQRSQEVVRATLERANGVCERCHREAPFKRRSDGMPYLEVHHTIPLASGGEDTLGNTVALCPNCHREAHHG